MSRTGPLNLNIKECKDLRSVQMLGTQSPYCKLDCGGEHFHTQVHKHGGKTPHWNQSFIFNLNGKEEAVRFTVRNKNLVSDDDIGRVDVPIADLCHQDGKDKWYELVDPNNFKHMCGKIHIGARLGSGTPAAAPAATTAATVIQQQPQQQPRVVYVTQQQQPQVVYTTAPQVMYQPPQPQVVYQPAQPQVVYVTQQPQQGMYANPAVQWGNPNPTY